MSYKEVQRSLTILCSSVLVSVFFSTSVWGSVFYLRILQTFAAFTYTIELPTHKKCTIHENFLCSFTFLKKWANICRLISLLVNIILFVFVSSEGSVVSAQKHKLCFNLLHIKTEFGKYTFRPLTYLVAAHVYLGDELIHMWKVPMSWDGPYSTVKSHKFKVFGSSGLFRIISGSIYREVDIRIYTQHKNIISGFLSNIIVLML